MDTLLPTLPNANAKSAQANFGQNSANLDDSRNEECFETDEMIHSFGDMLLHGSESYV